MTDKIKEVLEEFATDIRRGFSTESGVDAAQLRLDALYKARYLGMLPEEDIKVLLEPNSYGEGRVDGFNSAIQETKRRMNESS